MLLYKYYNFCKKKFIKPCRDINSAIISDFRPEIMAEFDFMIS